MNSYEQLTSRNWAFISASTQERLRTSRILLAGCGLGCNIARDLAAMGFGNFIVIDGDVVEMSNLNRQAYPGHYIGWQKAEATADIIKGINPEANVKVIDSYITQVDEIREEIRQSDFICQRPPGCAPPAVGACVPLECL